MLDSRFFKRITTRAQDGCVFEAYEAVYPRSTMVLFSRNTMTPLAALTLKAEEEGCLSMLTGRPSPKGAVEPYYQGMLNMPNQVFYFTISNLSEKGMINFNVLHTPHRVSNVDPGPSYGVNQVNELHANQSYTIEADQRSNCRMVLKGKTRLIRDSETGQDIEVALTVNDSEIKEKPTGLYFYLSVVPDKICHDLVKEFSEGTIWKVTPGFVRRVTTRAPPRSQPAILHVSRRTSSSNGSADAVRHFRLIVEGGAGGGPERMNFEQQDQRHDNMMEDRSNTFGGERERITEELMPALSSFTPDEIRSPIPPPPFRPFGSSTPRAGNTTTRFGFGGGTSTTRGTGLLRSTAPPSTTTFGGIGTAAAPARTAGLSFSGASPPSAFGGGGGTPLFASSAAARGGTFRAPPPTKAGVSTSATPAPAPSGLVSATTSLFGSSTTPAAPAASSGGTFSGFGFTALGATAANNKGSTSTTPFGSTSTTPVSAAATPSDFGGEGFGSTQAAELQYGSHVEVQSRCTGHDYAYEHSSEPTVLCMSIWPGMFFLALPNTELQLRQEIEEWVQNRGKVLIEGLNAVYKSETCVIDLESEADTIICTCGHQCINHANIGNNLRKCPMCRSPITAFVKADGILLG